MQADTNTTLDEFLPDYDFNEVHAVATDAPPGAVMDAIRTVTPWEVPVLVGLMALRSLPSLLRGRRPPVRGPLLDGFRRTGFVELSESPGELVFGGVGRFWEPAGSLRRIPAGDFGDFGEPGFAKAVFNLEVEQVGGRTLLITETRIAATDERSRRRFARYWRVVQPGSALIRLDWLRAIRRRAERASR